MQKKLCSVREERFLFLRSFKCKFLFKNPLRKSFIRSWLFYELKAHNYRYFQPDADGAISFKLGHLVGMATAKGTERELDTQCFCMLSSRAIIPTACQRY